LLVPAPTPVTVPVVLEAVLTVATPVLAEYHGVVVAGEPLPVKVVVPVPHIDNVPEMVGNANIVIVPVVALKL